MALIPIKVYPDNRRIPIKGYPANRRDPIKGSLAAAAAIPIKDSRNLPAP